MRLTRDGIIFLRFRHNLSKAAFARKVGISRPLVVLIENKNREVSAKTQRKIMSAFDLTPDDIVDIEHTAKMIKTKGAV